jgi:hypothetical protein
MFLFSGLGSSVSFQVHVVLLVARPLPTQYNPGSSVQSKTMCMLVYINACSAASLFRCILLMLVYIYIYACSPQHQVARPFPLYSVDVRSKVGICTQVSWITQVASKQNKIGATRAKVDMGQPPSMPRSCEKIKWKWLSSITSHSYRCLRVIFEPF